MKRKQDEGPGFSLYRKKSGIYYVRLWDHAAKKYTVAKSTGTTNELQAAVKAAAMVKADQIKTSDTDPLFRDAIREFWETRTGISAEHRRVNLAKIARHIQPSKHFKNVRLSQIGPHHINRLKTDLEKTASPRVVNTLLSAIKTFLNHCLVNGYLQTDFTRQIKRAKQPRSRRGWLEPDEIVRLAAVDWPDLRIKAAVLLACFGGLRKGEIRAIQWKSIDFDNLTISVERNFTGEWDRDGNPVYKEPKADSRGKFPFLTFRELRETLLRLKAFTPWPGPNDLVIPSAWPGKRPRGADYRPVSSTEILNGFYAMLEKIGIDRAERERRGIVFHSLRHSYASLLSIVTTPRTSMSLTRHATLSVHQDYTHENRAAAADALRAADGYLNKYREGTEDVETKDPGEVH